MEPPVSKEERTLALLLGFQGSPSERHWKRGPDDIWWSSITNTWCMFTSAGGFSKDLPSLKDVLLYWSQYYGNQS